MVQPNLQGRASETSDKLDFLGDMSHIGVDPLPFKKSLLRLPYSADRGDTNYQQTNKMEQIFLDSSLTFYNSIKLRF